MARRAATSSPAGLRTSGDRRQRLREAKQALEAQRAVEAEPIPRDRHRRLVDCKRRLEQEAELERRVVKEHQAWRERGIASDGSRRMSGAHTLKPHRPPEEPTRKINVTDPDARRMKFGRNFTPAYNAQAATTEDQVIVAAEMSSSLVPRRSKTVTAWRPCRVRSVLAVTFSQMLGRRRSSTSPR